MEEYIDRNVWTNYFNEFTRRNQSRPTQLEVFGENGAQKQGHGLPFAGISLERGNGRPSVQIMFGALNGVAPGHLTHVIENVQGITPKLALDGSDEALEIVGREGEKSLLRFEQRTLIPAQNPNEWSWCKSPFEFLSSVTLPPPPVRKNSK